MGKGVDQENPFSRGISELGYGLGVGGWVGVIGVGEGQVWRQNEGRVYSIYKIPQPLGGWTAIITAKKIILYGNIIHT